MSVACTNEINELNTNNVMNSQLSDKFVQKKSLFQKCVDSSNINQNNPFSEFCLYPPNQNRMITMCAPELEYAQGALFWQMLENEITDVQQLPRVITYKQYSSRRDWVIAPLSALECGFKTFTLANDLALTSDLKSCTLAIIDSRTYMLSPDSGLMEVIPEITETTYGICSSVACNLLGSVRCVIVQNAGAYIWTRTSNFFTRLVFLEVVTAFVALHVWDDNQQTIVLLVYATQTDYHLCFYSIPSSGDQTHLGVPYKDVKIATTPSSSFAWCLRHLNMIDIYFAVCRQHPSNNSQYYYETYFVGTDASSDIILKQIIFFAPQYVGFPGPQQCKYQGFFNADASQATIVLQNTVVFNIPVQSNFTITSLLNSPNTRVCTKGATSCYFFNNLFLINGVQQQPSDFKIEQTDVFAITSDEKYIFVISASSNGNGHMYEISTQTWSTTNVIDDRYKLLRVVNDGVDIKLDETMNDATEWFLGTSFYDKDSFESPKSLPQDIFMSRHSTFKIAASFRYPDTSVLRVDVLEVNVGGMIQKEERVVRLYDNGVINVYENQLNATSNTIFWSSFTNDQEGSPSLYAVLPKLQEQDDDIATANGVQRAVSSPNGRYLLLVYENDRVDLVLNPFNAPRFTNFTSQINKLQTAIDAQSTFCFRALNDGKSTNFVDKRCSCLPSLRLLGRVYEKAHLLDDVIQKRLLDDLPCISGDCQLTDAEFTNAKAFVGVKCIVPTGVCAQSGDINFDDNLLSTQNCGISLIPCSSSKTCPLGTSCRNGQCVAQCSADETCMSANMFARCINGDCKVLNAEQLGSRAGTRLSNLWIIVITIASVFNYNLNNNNNNEKKKRKKKESDMLSNYTINHFLFVYLWNDCGVVSLITSSKHLLLLKTDLLGYLQFSLFTKMSRLVEMSAYSAHELFAFRLQRHELYWANKWKNMQYHDSVNIVSINTKHLMDAQHMDNVVLFNKSPAYKSGAGIQWNKLMTDKEHIATQKLLKQRAHTVETLHIRIAQGPRLLAMIYHCFNISSFKKLQFLAQMAVDVLHTRGLAFITASARNQTSLGLFANKFANLKLEVKIIPETTLKRKLNEVVLLCD